MSDLLIRDQFVSKFTEKNVPKFINCNCQCAEHLKLSLENLVKTRNTLNKCILGVRQLEYNVKRIPKLKSVIRVQNQLINELTALSDNRLEGCVLPITTGETSRISTNACLEPTKKLHRQKINVINEVLMPKNSIGSDLSFNLNEQEDTTLKVINFKNSTIDKTKDIYCYNHGAGDVNFTQNSTFHRFKSSNTTPSYQKPLTYEQLELESGLSDLNIQNNEIQHFYKRRRVHGISRYSLSINSNDIEQLNEETKLRHSVDFSCSVLHEATYQTNNGYKNHIQKKPLIHLSTDNMISLDAITHDHFISIPETKSVSTIYHQKAPVALSLTNVTENVTELNPDVYSFVFPSKVMNIVKYAQVCRSVSPIVLMSTECSLQVLRYFKYEKLCFQPSQKLCVSPELSIPRSSSSIYGKIDSKSKAESDDHANRAKHIRNLYKKWTIECERDKERDNLSSSVKLLMPVNQQKPSFDLEEVTDLSAISECELISVSDVVSLFAEDVLVEISNEFKRYAFDKFIDGRNINCSGAISFHTPFTSNVKKDQFDSKMMFSQSLEMILSGAYSDVIPDGFVNSCYFLQQWLHDSTLITTADLNSALSTVRDCWFSIADENELMIEKLDNYLEVLSYFTTPTIARVMNQVNKQGNTMLHSLIKNKSWKMIGTFLRKCAHLDVNKMNYAGLTPLMLSTDTISQPMGVDEHASIDILIKRSHVDLVSANEQRTTALILAVTNRRVELVKRLIINSDCVDVNLSDAAGDTALMVAVRWNYWEIVRLIVTHAAAVDIEHQNKIGETALNIAKSNDNCDIAMLLFVKQNMQSNETNAKPMNIAKLDCPTKPKTQKRQKIRPDFRI